LSACGVLGSWFVLENKDSNLLVMKNFADKPEKQMECKRAF
jgi:hypothetical protein